MNVDASALVRKFRFLLKVANALSLISLVWSPLDLPTAKIMASCLFVRRPPLSPLAPGSFLDPGLILFIALGSPFIWCLWASLFCLAVRSLIGVKI